jgi:hypothetical protein
VKIFQTVRKVRKALVGLANARKDALLGLTHETRVSALLSRPVVGLVHQLLVRAQSPQTLGLRHEVLVTGSARAETAAGLLHDTRTAVAPRTAVAGLAITRYRFDNVVEYDPASTVGYAIGADNDWTGLANFSSRDALEASISGGKGTASLTPKNGGIRGTLASASAGKDPLTITAVSLRIYVRQTGTLLDNGTLKWGVEGTVARVQLGAATADLDGEQIHDLTALIGGDWARLRGLQVWVEGSSANLSRSCFARYAYARITSNRTETI